MTSKEGGHSERNFFLNVSCKETVVYTFVSIFTKLGFYGDKKRTKLARNESAKDDSMIKMTIKRSPTSSRKKIQCILMKKKVQCSV